MSLLAIIAKYDFVMDILLTSDSESDSVVRVSYPRECLSESVVLSSSTLDNIRKSNGSVI